MSDGDVTEADRLLSEYKGQLTSIPAQMVLREAYDEYFGIYNHTADPLRNGLGMVSHHQREDYGDYGPILHMIYRYRFYNIYQHFGLSLTEFLALPREYTTAVFEVVAHENAVGAKDLRGLIPPGGFNPLKP